MPRKIAARAHARTVTIGRGAIVHNHRALNGLDDLADSNIVRTDLETHATVDATQALHNTGLNLERDVKVESFCDVAKPVAGGICPVCGKHSINISRGIEVGNIFQLGTKYSHAMGLEFQKPSDDHGLLRHRRGPSVRFCVRGAA